MDGARFDRLARRLGDGRTRRGVLAEIAALAAIPAIPAGAGCGGCPADRPCCIGGRCRPRCGDECCRNCFIEKDTNTGLPIPGTEVCCGGDEGEVCFGRKRGRKDDRCCYPDETCVKGRCCGQDVLGSKRCGARCCPIASCCNGACCPKGKVCAGDPPTCRAADRPCGDGCEPDEACVGGACCAGDRICADTEAGTVCCPYGEYCDTSGPIAPRCCPVNTICNTFRGGRVRP